MKTIVFFIILLASVTMSADVDVMPVELLSTSGKRSFDVDQELDVISLANLPRDTKRVKLSLKASCGSKVKGSPRMSIIIYHDLDPHGQHYFVSAKAGDRANAIFEVPLRVGGTIRIRMMQFGGMTLSSGASVYLLGYN